MSKKYKAKSSHTEFFDSWMWLMLLTAALFLAVFFAAKETIKTTGVILMPLAAVLILFRFRTLRQRTHLPVIALLLLMLMTAISTSYAPSGKFALAETLKHLCAFSVGISLLAVIGGKDAQPGRRFATVLEGAGTLCALFSVDYISTRLLTTPLLNDLGSSVSSYQTTPGVESGVRMLSIFGNPNVFAGSVGICVLLALGLALSSTDKKERFFHLCCLFISSTAFVLAFSMGATAAIAVAFIAYLLLERKGRRLELFFLMLETLILALLAAALTSSVAFDAWDGMQPIPLLSLAVGAALLCLADSFVGQKCVPVLRQHKKLVFTLLLVLLLIIVIFAVAACLLTGAVQLEAKETLHRTAYPAAGNYTLSFEGGEGVRVTVETQNRQDTMMHTRTELFDGALSEAAFTVPEDSLVVHFTFQAEQDTLLSSVSFEGENGTRGKVPLKYLLLPNFIANRLQGLWANENAIQRLVFFQDGIKLFRESPVYGLGIGAFENAIHRVQDFFYGTKFVHNHYIQVLLEMGIIGLVLFLGLLGACAATILLSRKKENCHPLTAALGAVLVFMAFHCATEVVFSSYYYLPFAYGVVMLISLCCGESISLKGAGKTVQIIALTVAAVFLLVFTFLLGNNISTRKLTEKQKSFDTLTQAVKTDAFEWADYALAYVISAMNGEVDEAIKQQAESYAQRLAKVNSNSLPLYLTQYYLSQGNLERGMEMAERYGKHLSSSSEAWNNLFKVLATYEEDTDAYRAGLAHIVEVMEAWDNEHIGSIELTAESRAFIDEALAQ